MSQKTLLTGEPTTFLANVDQNSPRYGSTRSGTRTFSIKHPITQPTSTLFLPLYSLLSKQKTAHYLPFSPRSPRSLPLLFLPSHPCVSSRKEGSSALLHCASSSRRDRRYERPHCLVYSNYVHIPTERSVIQQSRRLIDGYLNRPWPPMSYGMHWASCRGW